MPSSVVSRSASLVQRRTRKRAVLLRVRPHGNFPPSRAGLVDVKQNVWLAIYWLM